MPQTQDEDTPEIMEASTEQAQKVPNLSNTRRIFYLQILMGVIANVGSLSPGMSLGFSAIALPQLTSPGSDIQMDADQASWFAGVAAIAMPLGCLLAGPIMDRFGRKVMLLSVNVPSLAGWLLLATPPASSAGVAQLYAGRALTGLSLGMTSIPATIYLAEIAASSAMRSTLVTWTSIAIAAGILTVYVLGALLQESWRLIAGICAIFPVVSFCATLVMLPESPVWLISKERPEPALKSLKTLRGQKSSHETALHVQAEFDQLTFNHANSMASQQKESLRNNLAFFLRAEAYKPLIIMNVYFFFQQASGVFVVIFYAVDVAEEAGVSIDGYLAAVLIGLMRFLVTVVVSVASKRWGRRPASVFSGVGMSLTMLSLAAFLSVRRGGWISDWISPQDVASASWLPVSLLLVYIGTATCGFLTLPWAMLGELFPARIRGTASGLTTCLTYVFSFVVVKSYPQMLAAMGSDGVFFLYGAMCVAGTVFVTIFLPETKDKSAEEIENYFKKRPEPQLETSGGGNEIDIGPALPLLEKTSSANNKQISIVAKA